MLMADKVVPMEIGEVVSETDVMEDAVMDRRDREEEVAVDVKSDESLSTELVDAWLLPATLGSVITRVMCKVDF